MYRVQLTHTTQKRLTHIDRRFHPTIIKALERLEYRPHAGEPLTGKFKGLWKLRVSSFRIIYQIIHERLLILVVDVRHRHEVYR